MRPAIRKALLPAVLFYSVLGLAFSGSHQTTTLPVPSELGKWSMSESPEYYERNGLYGYINGGAEIFHQYGFLNLHVLRYTTGIADREKEITLELYCMESPASAFGIFSLRRTGEEETSGAVKSLNWVSETQASFVKSSYLAVINGFQTDKVELVQFTAQAADTIRGDGEKVQELDWLPVEGLVPRSERYIRGELAARGESVLLAEGMWGFDRGTIAVSARYNPSDAKIVVIDFGRETEDLSLKVHALFEEYLEDVSTEEGIVRGKNPAGNYFLYTQEERKAILLLGEPQLDRGERLLREAGKRTVLPVLPPGIR